MGTRNITDKHGRSHVVSFDEDGNTTLSFNGFTIGPMPDPGDGKLIELVSMHDTSPVDMTPSYREEQAEKLFEVLSQETTDDRILVLGEAVATILDLIGSNIVSGKISTTADATVLLSKVASVRAAIPKGTLKNLKV